MNEITACKALFFCISFFVLFAPAVLTIDVRLPAPPGSLQLVRVHARRPPPPIVRVTLDNDPLPEAGLGSFLAGADLEGARIGIDPRLVTVRWD